MYPRPLHVIPLFISFMGLCLARDPLPPIDHIHVCKSAREMRVYQGDKLIKTYKVALGFSPVGHKQKQGDGKTPEGKYTICAKNPQSRFHKSLKVSYPCASDRACAAKNCVNPGGDIMIHGIGAKYGHLGSLHLNRDWTLGCIALTNEEIEELYRSIKTGTTIEIIA